jgi:hypothetical protein
MTSLLDEQDIQFSQISEEWVSLVIQGQKFILDLDTLYDVAIKAAKALADTEDLQQEDTCLCEHQKTH